MKEEEKRNERFCVLFLPVVFNLLRGGGVLIVQHLGTDCAGGSGAGCIADGTVQTEQQSGCSETVGGGAGGKGCGSPCTAGGESKIKH